MYLRREWDPRPPHTHTHTADERDITASAPMSMDEKCTPRRASRRKRLSRVFLFVLLCCSLGPFAYIRPWNSSRCELCILWRHLTVDRRACRGKFNADAEQIHNVMIVAAQFEEDVHWLQECVPYPHIIYTHNPHAPPLRIRAKTIQGVVSVRPNAGREASLYLKYILDNYEDLRPVTAFIHAHRAAWHHRDMVHTLRYVHEAPRWGYMRLNDATEAGGSHLDPTWAADDVSMQSQPMDCYSESAQGLNAENRRLTYADISRVWRRVFEEHLGPLPEVIHHDCCAQFAVTREVILNRPKAFYTKCYNWLMGDANGLPSERSARVFEQMWHTIFSDGYACNRTTDVCRQCQLYQHR